MASLTYERAREMLHYNPQTGVLKWAKDRRMGPKLAGKHAGFVDGNGRLMIQLDLETYHSGRVIWLWMMGHWPVGVIDHCDGNPLNNRWKNLRDVTQRVNAQNRLMNANNKSGVRGVYWNNQIGKWHAQIALDRKKIHLGYFDELTTAVAARRNAESTLWNLPKGVVAISL
jgi:hypothetical protein